MLWAWGWCVYIGCHSGKCGDVNVLIERIKMLVYTKIWEEELQELESSQDRVIKESIA